MNVTFRMLSQNELFLVNGVYAALFFAFKSILHYFLIKSNAIM